jgi:hypothetical protein
MTIWSKWPMSYAKRTSPEGWAAKCHSDTNDLSDPGLRRKRKMFTPIYTLAKIRQNEYLRMSAQGTKPQSEINMPAPQPVSERLLLNLGNLLIASGERLKCAVEPSGCQPMPAAHK